MKVLATTLGETGGDTVTMTSLGETTGNAVPGGYLIGTAMFGLLLVVPSEHRNGAGRSPRRCSPS